MGRCFSFLVASLRFKIELPVSFNSLASMNLWRLCCPVHEAVKDMVAHLKLENANNQEHIVDKIHTCETESLSWYKHVHFGLELGCLVNLLPASARTSRTCSWRCGRVSWNALASSMKAKYLMWSIPTLLCTFSRLEDYFVSVDTLVLQ